MSMIENKSTESLTNNCLLAVIQQPSDPLQIFIQRKTHKERVPENDTTRMLCLSLALSCPGLVFTTILSLSFILSGPQSNKVALQSLRLPQSQANVSSETSNCTVFLSSQCRAHKLTSHSSSSRRKSKSSLNLFHLNQTEKNSGFSFHLYNPSLPYFCW